jgi:hypothetical protein
MAAQAEPTTSGLIIPVYSGPQAFGNGDPKRL